MADVVDKANAWRDLEAELRIKVIRSAGPEVEATGTCLFCDEPVAEGRRWCSAEHRDNWERQRANNKT